MLVMMLYVSFVYSEDKASLKVGDTAPKFALKDPYENMYSLDSIIGRGKTGMKLLILVIGDRHSRESGNKWVKELDKVYCGEKEIEIFMVADLRGLPFFATETLVKLGIKRERLPRIVLLDWDGKVNDLYKTQPSKSNLFVIDHAGKIIHTFVGKLEKDELKTLDTQIHENINKSLVIHKEIKK
jgi:hypothetical protein